MSAPRVAIIGDGKMGRAVNEAAAARGWPVVAVLGRVHAPITRENLGGADVAIEFTTPAAAPANAIACARAGVPVVVGTTGWDAERERVEREVRAANGAMLASPNFALGVAIYLEVAERLAQLANRAHGFSARIVETHHTSKVDAPSGTAKALARAAGAAFGGEMPIESVRTGTVTGVHELTFDGEHEEIHLTHVARDRRVFAEGALTAAAWLVGRHGVFTMRDLMGA